MTEVPTDTTTRNVLHYQIPSRLQEVVSADVFMINNKMLLCIVEYYTKLPIVKKVGSLAVDDLVQMAKMIFTDYGLPKKESFKTQIQIAHQRHSELFQADGHPAVCNIMLPSPEQWPSRDML